MKKIGNSIKGIFIGIILLLGGISLLWYNESNNVKNIKAVAEGRNMAIDIASSPIDSTNNDKLVNVNGPMEIKSGAITDPDFNVTVTTAKLVRKVEIYQWYEDDDEDTDGNVTYSYQKKWGTDLVDSTNFNQPAGHENVTTLPYQSATYLANEVNLGEFELSDEQKNSLSNNLVLSPVPEDATILEGYQITGEYITSSTDLTVPQVGDIRISFAYNDDSKITILAKQDDQNLVAYTTTSGKKINMIKSGEYSATEMLDQLEDENKFFKWVLRGVGTLLIIIGFGAMLGPISTIANFVPILGNIVGFAVALVAFLLGLAISLTVIAIAWLVYRPIIGASLLAGVIAVIIILFKYLKSKKPNVNQPEQAITKPQPISPPVSSPVPPVMVQPSEPVMTQPVPPVMAQPSEPVQPTVNSPVLPSTPPITEPTNNVVNTPEIPTISPTDNNQPQ